MTDSTSESDAMRTPYRRWTFLALLIAAFAVFNIALDPTGLAHRGTYNHYRMLPIGAQFVQPLLLSAWAVLGPPPAVARSLLTVLVLSVVILARPVFEWLATMPPAVPRPADARATIEMWLLFGIALVPALLMRKYFRWQLSLDPRQNAASFSSQFSLKYLLGLTAIVAVVLVAGRAVGWFARLGIAGVWRGTTGNLLFESGLLWLLFFPIVVLALIALSPRPAARAIALAVFILAGSTTLVLAIAHAMFGQGNPDLTVRILFFQSGALAFSIVTAAAMRIAGFRLVTSRAAASSTATPQPLH